MAMRTGETDHASQPGEREIYQAGLAPRSADGSLGLSGRHVPGTGGPMRWFFSSIWLIYVIQPVVYLFRHPHGVLWIAGGLAITAAFCVIYVSIIVNVDRWPRLARPGLVAISLLAALACVVYGFGWTPLWIYVSAAAGMILAAASRRRTAVLGVLVTAALFAFFSWLTHLSLGSFFALLLPVLLVGLAMIGFRMQIMLMHELGRARGAVAKLAANEERLRLARDMHDLTGQSLSMITLKSDLAAKRLTKVAPSAERDAVLGELGDIGRVSRQTLHDIREAVSGYHRPTLAIEVITARSALEAAAIRLDDDPALTIRSGTVDPGTEAVLAWCLREAVTNVIRHSEAKNCRIRLGGHGGELSLEVTDDGRGPAQADLAGQADLAARAALDRQAPRGSGLRGMSERLSAVGGRLSLGPVDPGGASRGFRLTATVAEGPAAGHDG